MLNSSLLTPNFSLDPERGAFLRLAIARISGEAERIAKRRKNS